MLSLFINDKPPPAPQATVIIVYEPFNTLTTEMTKSDYYSYLLLLKFSKKFPTLIFQTDYIFVN